MADINRTGIFNALHGHEDFKEKEVDKELFGYYLSLSERMDDYSFIAGWENVMDFKKDSKDFMSSLFTLHDVGYLDSRTLTSLLLNSFSGDVENIACCYNSSAKIIDPYKLPIKYDELDMEDSILKESMIVLRDKEKILELLKKINVYFRYILMSNGCDYNWAASFSHVITHSQLDSNKGIINDFYNGEVIPIFVELLHAYEIADYVFCGTLLNKVQDMLIDFFNIMNFDTKSDVDLYNKNMNMRYIISTMKAINLFELYIRSSDSVRKEMISSIQANFDGKLLVEDTLKRFDINIESSEDPNKVIQLLR